MAQIRLGQRVQYVDSANFINRVLVQIPNKIITRTETRESSGTMVVPTTSTGTPIPMNDVSDPGIACFQNLDPTNYVQIGFDDGGTFVPCFWVSAGMPALLELEPGPTWLARANTSPVSLSFNIFQREP